MQERQRVPTDTPWAAMVGYSRAVRVGRHIYVGGTGPFKEDGSIEHPRDTHQQARRCCEIIVGALKDLGAGPEHVVRTRIYLRRIEDWMDVGTAHDEFFGSARPVTTLITVAGFLHPSMMVEMEAEAEI